MIESAELAATADPKVAVRRGRLEQLYGDHAAAVFAYALRRSTFAEADEVVSETFLVAWRRLDDVPDQERAWLLGVARRALANRARSETRQTLLRMRLAATPVRAPTDDGPDDSVTERVRAALARLSPRERDVLTMLAWDELTAAEIAVVLGCSRGAVYLLVHRARRRLGALLTEVPPIEGDQDDRRS